MVTSPDLETHLERSRMDPEKATTVGSTHRAKRLQRGGPVRSSTMFSSPRSGAAQAATDTGASTRSATSTSRVA
jgi:hypothetical protein